MALSDVAAAILRLLEKWGGAIAAFFAGKKAAEGEARERENETLKDQIEAERRVSDALSDDDALRRMRERHTRVEPK